MFLPLSIFLAFFLPFPCFLSPFLQPSLNLLLAFSLPFSRFLSPFPSASLTLLSASHCLSLNAHRGHP